MHASLSLTIATLIAFFFTSGGTEVLGEDKTINLSSDEKAASSSLEAAYPIGTPMGQVRAGLETQGFTCFAADANLICRKREQPKAMVAALWIIKIDGDSQGKISNIDVQKRFIGP